MTADDLQQEVQRLKSEVYHLTRQLSDCRAHQEQTQEQLQLETRRLNDFRTSLSYEQTFSNRKSFALDSVTESYQITINNLMEKNEDLRETSEELARARQAIDKAGLLERKRIAYGLHDYVINPLDSIGKELSTVSKAGASNAEALKDLKDRCSQLSHRMRELMEDLYPKQLAEEGLVAGLRELMEITSRRDTSRTMTTRGPFCKIDFGKTTRQQFELYSIFQEASNNILKHAHASEIEFLIIERNPELIFSLVDNGDGMPTANLKQGEGSQTMRDRALAIGARLDVLTGPDGHGTEVRLTVDRKIFFARSL